MGHQRALNTQNLLPIKSKTATPPPCIPNPQLQQSRNTFQQHTDASSFLGFDIFFGNSISLARYSFSLCTFCCSDSTDLFCRRKSTAMPIVRASRFLMPAACTQQQLKLLHCHTTSLHFTTYTTVIFTKLHL